MFLLSSTFCLFSSKVVSCLNLLKFMGNGVDPGGGSQLKDTNEGPGGNWLTVLNGPLSCNRNACYLPSRLRPVAGCIHCTIPVVLTPLWACTGSTCGV